MKREGMTIDNNNIEWFVNMVKVGAYKIPEIQNQYAKAKDELEVIEYKRVMSKHELDNMNSQIILLRSYLQLALTREMILHIYRIKFKYWKALLMISLGLLIGINRRILIRYNLIKEGKEKILEK